MAELPHEDSKNLRREGSVNSLPRRDDVKVSSDTEMSFSDAINETRLMRLIDFIVVPWMSFLYLHCFLDIIGIGSARLYGTEDDLNVSHTQYLIYLTVLFVPYALLEALANICMKLMKPSVWLSTMITCWGTLTMRSALDLTISCYRNLTVDTKIIQGLVRNFNGLLVVRILIGVFESGFMPRASYYLSCWNRRDELGLRLTIFTSAVTLVGAFGGLLAAVIANTCMFGRASWTIRHGSVQRALLLRTYQNYSIDPPRLGVGSATVTYAFAFFPTNIFSTLGYTSTRANPLYVPVYAAASIFAYIISCMADRLRKRRYFAIGLSSTGKEGFPFQIIVKPLSHPFVLKCFSSFIVLTASRSKVRSYFASVEVAKRDKGDEWNGYRYII
ncbi:hypothetical protein ACEPAI_2690 [Sanghuangporus weigelae]